MSLEKRGVARFGVNRADVVDRARIKLVLVDGEGHGELVVAAD